MKALRIASEIAFAIGFLLLLGAAGTSDVMHQVHWIQIISGILLMLPLPIICKEGRNTNG